MCTDWRPAAYVAGQVLVCECDAWVDSTRAGLSHYLAARAGFAPTGPKLRQVGPLPRPSAEFMSVSGYASVSMSARVSVCVRVRVLFVHVMCVCVCVCETIKSRTLQISTTILGAVRDIKILNDNPGVLR